MGSRAIILGTGLGSVVWFIGRSGRSVYSGAQLHRTRLFGHISTSRHISLASERFTTTHYLITLAGPSLLLFFALEPVLSPLLFHIFRHCGIATSYSVLIILVSLLMEVGGIVRYTTLLTFGDIEERDLLVASPRYLVRYTNFAFFWAAFAPNVVSLCSLACAFCCGFVAFFCFMALDVEVEVVDDDRLRNRVVRGAEGGPYPMY
jgi:hypothetical protein